MEDKELFNPQTGEKIAPKKPKKFYKDWRFYVYTLIAIMLAIVSFSSCFTACAAINAGVGSSENTALVQGRKTAKGTTDRGGYDKYTFSVSLDFEENKTKSWLYSFDTSTWTPTLVETLPEGSPQNRFDIASYYNNSYETVYEARKNDGNVYLLVGSGNNHFWNSSAYTWTIYVSFLMGLNGQNTNLPTETFICTSNTNSYSFPVDATSTNWGFTTNSTNRNILITYQKSDVFFQWNELLPSTITFQDIASYYLEQGYSNGYDAGSSDGYETGHSAGYNEGYASGNANGYASGYEQATRDYQTGIAFTSYGLYANAQLTLTSDEVIGNYSYMYLFKYVTSNYDEHTVYVLFTLNSSTSQYLGYVLDRNDSDDSTAAVTIGSFSAQTSLAVTITAEQDQYFELYTGFVTSFYDRGSEVIEAVWFSGGTSQTALQNYQDGYDTGYQDGVSVGYGSGYDAGYRVGEVAGINQAEPEALTNTLVAVFQQPFNQIYRFFNFNILGLNVLGLATGLLSVFIIIKVFKKVLK